MVRRPSLQLECTWETLGPATTQRSLPHQTQKRSAGLQVPERSGRGPPLGRSSVISGWQPRGACEVAGQGTAAWPPGRGAAVGLERSGEQELPAWPRALGLPPEPTSAPPQVCSGLGTERAGGASQTRQGFSGITPSSAGPDPSILLHLGPAQLFSTPASPKPCLFFLLSLPGSSYFSPGRVLLLLPRSSALSHALPATLFPALSTPHSLLPRGLCTACPRHLQILDLGSGFRETSSVPSHLTAGLLAVAWPLFKSDWQRIPTPVYHRAKERSGGLTLAGRNPAPPRTALVEWGRRPHLTPCLVADGNHSHL